MAGFSPELLDEIRSRLDIVEIVGQFVNLKRAGQHWKGSAPSTPRRHRRSPSTPSAASSTASAAAPAGTPSAF